MQKFSYWCLYGSLYGLSLLPFPLLYALSDGVCFLLFHVFGYRKAVVYQNLRNAFPEKSPAEIDRMARAFYHYLCDLFLEMFKTLSISKRTMLRRCRMSPEALALFNELAAEGKSLILVLGHLGNWEWAGNTFSLLCSQPLSVIYHPLSSPAFDRLMYKMRTRFGTGLIDMNSTFRVMVKEKGTITATAFIADQTPQPQRAYWTTFMNQDTPVFLGPETIARKRNYPVVYTAAYRERRGYYRIHAERLVDEPANTADGEITELHTRRLEKDIIQHPEIWLWSHRRWKHVRPVPEPVLNPYPC
jgi:Kdo2-lipid IVA lauroyltransferase/acyltransferase